MGNQGSISDVSIRYTGAARHDGAGNVWFEGGDGESPELGIGETGVGAAVNAGDHDNKGILVPLYYCLHTAPHKLFIARFQSKAWSGRASVLASIKTRHRASEGLVRSYRQG